jgi:hypothetical protein
VVSMLLSLPVPDLLEALCMRQPRRAALFEPAELPLRGLGELETIFARLPQKPLIATSLQSANIIMAVHAMYADIQYLRTGSSFPMRILH